jgi:hypothetical protein
VLLVEKARFERQLLRLERTTPDPIDAVCEKPNQNCSLMCVDHVCLTRSPSAAEITPIRPINSDCSRQSSRDKRTVDSRRNPEAFHSANKTSYRERGLAVVTAAATKSLPSNQSTSTGRFFEITPPMKGMSATQNSPGRIIIVETFVLGSVAIQKGRMIANRIVASIVSRPNGYDPMPRTNYSCNFRR